MSNVTCESMHCIYNKANKCHKSEINIIGIKAKRAKHTECLNFIKDQKDVYSYEISEFNGHSAPDKITLNCTASLCIFNKKFRCNKSEVKIKGKFAIKSEETICESFKSKSI